MGALVAGCSPSDSANCTSCDASNDGAGDGLDLHALAIDAGTPVFAVVCEVAGSFRLGAVSGTSVQVLWSSAAGVGVTLQRKTYCATDAYITIASLSADGGSYTDTSVQSNYVYWYAITAVDERGDVASRAIPIWANAASQDVGCSGGETPAPSDVVPSEACSSVPAGDAGSTH